MKRRTNLKVLWVLFKSMFTLDACTFGGGLVIVSLMKEKFVGELHWMEEDEMLGITAITQPSPGPLPANVSVIIRYQMHGVLDSLTAVLGTIIPSVAVILLISAFYQRFRENTCIAIVLQMMRVGMAAVICSVVISLAGNAYATKRSFYITMVITTFVNAHLPSVSTVTVILMCLDISLADLETSSYKGREKSEVVVK